MESQIRKFPARTTAYKKWMCGQNVSRSEFAIGPEREHRGNIVAATYRDYGTFLLSVRKEREGEA